MFLKNLLKNVCAFFKVIFILIVTQCRAIRAFVLLFVPRSFRRRNISGQIALVTGSASGLGKLTAIKLAAKGTKVVLWDVDERGNEETSLLIKKNGGKSYTYTVDLCSKESIFANAKLVQNEVGKVDILVNNAGIGSSGSLTQIKNEKIETIFKINILSHFWTLKSFLPSMQRENSGHIVTIASIAGKFGAYNLTDYCATKYAAVGLDESLALGLELDGFDGISTTVVCPYFTQTPMAYGVKSRVISVMTPDYVTSEIVDAILMRKRELILPCVFAILIAFKGLAPHKTLVDIYRTLVGEDALLTPAPKISQNIPDEFLRKV